MASAGPPAQPIVLSPFKRSACDRCRNQKLRCPPRAHITEPCSRCTRLGVATHCVTSHHRPAPRVVKKSQSLACDTPLEWKTPSTQQRLRQSSTGQLAQFAHPLPEALPPGSGSLPWDNDTDLFHSRAVDNFLSTDTHLPQCSPKLPTSELLLTANTPIPLHHLSPPCTDNGLQVQLRYSEAGLDFEEEESRQFYSGCTPALDINVVDHDQGLASLNYRVAVRLEQSLPGYDATWCTGDSPSQGSTSSAESSGITSHMLGDTLHDTVEFIRIAESHAPPPEAPTRPLTTSCPGPVVLLNLLSVYLQLVAVYDKLVQHYYSQVYSHGDIGFSSSTSPPDPSPLLYDFAPQKTAGIEVAGFQVQQGILQTKIVLDTIVHHIAAMEQVMDLPEIWAVTDRQRNVRRSGVFCSKQARIMSEAVAHGSVLWLDQPTAVGVQIPAVASLRQSIARLEVLVS